MLSLSDNRGRVDVARGEGVMSGAGVLGRRERIIYKVLVHFQVSLLRCNVLLKNLPMNLALRYD